MNQKQIGIIVLIIGLLVGGFTAYTKHSEDLYIDELIIAMDGSCYLADGTCLHADRNWIPYIAGGILSAAMIILGIYLLVFDKTQARLAEQQLHVSEALKEARVRDETKGKFEAYLAGFSDDEQRVLEAVREQDGIKQATLRFRTGMSKTSLSVMLKSLEEREIVSRKPDGKTNQVFLRKKF